MKKKFILHIGISKTASSTLQKSLFSNKGKLLSCGVKYLEAGKLSSNDIAHTGFAFSMLDKAPEWANPDDVDHSGCIEKIFDEVDGSDCEYFLCSSEALSSVRDEAKLNLLCDAMKGVCDIKVVIYLRRPDRWVYSWFCQTLKNHPFSKYTFSEFMRTARYEFFDTIFRYAKVFGEDAVIPILYESLKTDHITVERSFVDAVGLPIDVDRFQGTNDENVTPGVDVLTFFRWMNEFYDMEASDRVEFYKQVVQLSSKFSFSYNGHGDVSPDEKLLSDFLEKYTEEISLLSKMYPGLRFSELGWM